MEEVWRHAHNTRRMDSGRGGSICRRFLNGSCQFGPRCNYRHEWPVIPSAQICRYFQKGGCWYGDQCRYLHVLQPEVAAGRRGSVPTVSSSRVVYTPPIRRGSEPVLLQAELTSRQLINVSHPHHSTRHLSPHIAEEQPQDSAAPLTAHSQSVQSSEVVQACSSNGGNQQETSPREWTEAGAAAAASGPQGSPEETKAFLQSKDLTCGICMDKVYEKNTPRNKTFGILPNCNHCFCLQCIMTWRKTKDLGPDVVKRCPQCRVRSAFYVPHKLWVEGQEKETLIADFKRNFSRKRCNYYTRYRCCPFKSECLYWHDKEPYRGLFPYYTEEEDEICRPLFDAFIALAFFNESSDDDDDYDDLWLPM
ncbi:makorin, ring finger protein, 4 isoform X2 [Centropristis striata]|uniref:makorin, ring finger protein, 4 isoform X2 n=1 Tax=Centropristis striata TaxID=184440 RepID=UPI0027E098E5|nr:makorin, ring finger protein, 4 isoform X2 [Centropristis striata]